MKIIRALFILLAFPAFADNARTITRVSDMLEGSEVDPIVWYQGESVTFDVFAKRGNQRVEWPSTASSVLRVWVDGTPNTLYVDKTNDVYAASTGQTRNTLTPAQSNLATNDYKFSVAVYDSTTFMGIAAEGDLEVRYAPQTGLPLVTPVAPTDNDTLGDLTPTAGRIIYGNGTAWATLAAGTTGQVLTAQGAASPIWSSAGAGDVTGVAVSGGLLTGGGTSGDLTIALTTNTLNTAGMATDAEVAAAIAGTHAAATVTGGLLTLSGQQIGLSTSTVRTAVSGIYLPLATGGTLSGDLELANLAGYSAAVGFRDGFSNLLQLRVNASGELQFNGATVWHSGNDGAGSTLDAATLDNESSADYHNASNLASGTVPDAVTAAKYRQPVISFSYRDLTWNTTAGAGWTGYEIESGASGSKRTFGLDAITSAVATDQTGTFKTDWVPVPANFLAFKTTGAIKVTWVSSQAVVGESELRGIRLIGSSDLTGANATDLYTDTTTRDITTTGVPVAVSINRSAFASTTVPAYICVQIDASVEDGDKLAIIAVEVLSE